MKNLQILLKNRPVGIPKPDDFELFAAKVTNPNAGEVLVRNLWLSLDPYMRGRISNAKSYVNPVEIGEVMVGATVGEVVESLHPDFKVGDKVLGTLGWQLYATSKGDTLRKIPDSQISLSAYLGVLGMPGVTAWIGVNKICFPKPGETLIVSAAAGAVGSTVGQIAKLIGCRVVGIAGGEKKCLHVVEELGFDACVDYKANNLHEDLEIACPNGIDVCFENVGAQIFDEVLSLVNPFARITLCGLIAQSSAIEAYRYLNIRNILVNRVRLQGFIVFDHMTDWDNAVSELSRLLFSDKLKYYETVAYGLDSAPEAFIGMLQGANLGKQLVRLT